MALHYWLRAIISGGFSGYIVYLSRNDSLQYYIAPRMEVYVKLVAVAMIMIAVYQVFAALLPPRGKPLDCGCSHAPSGPVWRNMVVYILLSSPLLLGYVLPDKALGSTLAEKKGVVLSAGESLSSVGENDNYQDLYWDLAQWLSNQEPIVVRDNIFIELTTAIDLYKNELLGKSIQVQGFVYREEGMPQNQFVLTRMGMDCCTADTTPYGFVVKALIGAVPSEDQWVRVSGKIKKTHWEGKEIVLILSEQIEQIPVPNAPYVYPNYEILN